jgi:hypothetical protein
MSAYKKIDLALVDRDTLLQSLKEMGLEVALHETPQPLVGYEGQERAEKAEIIVPRSSVNRSFTCASNDIGFRQGPSGYAMICSEYDSREKMPQRVKQAYTKVALEKAFAENRFTIIQDTGDVSSRDRINVRIVASKIV